MRACMYVAFPISVSRITRVIHSAAWLLKIVVMVVSIESRL